MTDFLRELIKTSKSEPKQNGPSKVVMATNPWTDTDADIEQLINKTIMELNPQILDDDLPDAFQDYALRHEAIEYLVSKLIKGDVYANR